MRKNKVLTLYFTNVEEMHLGKDVLLTPYYLGKELGYKVRIIYPMTETNKNLPSEYRGVRMLPINWRGDVIHSRLLRWLVMLSMWVRFIMRSDVFMLFHYYSMRTPYMGVIYKLFHLGGKLYVKMDASLIALKKDDNYKNSFEKVYNNLWHWAFSKVVDCITCETQVSYNFIMNSNSSMYKFKNQLFIVPNAFDDERQQEMKLKVKKFEEKKNQFITVGRIGAPEKNNEMLLRALSNVDLKDWTMLFIGPYDDQFAKKISRFYCDNPTKKNNVIFVGNITDSYSLWQYYNDSKVFVFTSRTEGAPLVFVEANRFHNYIVSTNVGSFLDVIENGKYGEEVKQDDDKDLTRRMQDIIDRKNEINSYDNDYPGLIWSNVIKPVADRLR